MKPKYIIVLATGLIFVSILLALIPGKRYSEIIISASTILAAIGTISTVVVALLLFNRFKIDQSIIDKQGEEVLKLLFKFWKVNFKIISNSAGEYTLSISMLRTFKTSEILEKVLPHAKIIVKLSFFDYLKDIFDNSENGIFIPNEIAVVMVPSGFAFAHWDGENAKSIVRIEHARFQVQMTKVDDDLVLLTDGTHEMTLDKFISRWVEIIQAIEKWIIKNAPSSARSLGLK